MHSDGRQILAPVSAGDLIDRVTILRIKSLRFTRREQLAHVRIELAALERSMNAALAPSNRLTELITNLQRTNETLWEIEDAIRLRESHHDFGAAFIELARSVYKTNDQRCEIKRQINELVGSAIVEEKSYAGEPSASAATANAEQS